MIRVGQKARTGFTIIELIIVIVIIALLASITLVSYRGSQGRARDSTRQSSLTDIRSALESYRAENGTYPPPAVSGSWEYSYTNAATFLDDLKPYMGSVPVDPINDSTHTFYYYRYAAGTSGYGPTCPSSRGEFYVLGVMGLETVTGPSVSPGWNCEDPTNPTVTNTNWTTATTRAAWGAFSL